MSRIHRILSFSMSSDSTASLFSVWPRTTPAALLVVCDWELVEARRKDAIDRARVRGEQPPAELVAEARGIHSSVETDVRKLLEGKSHEELVALQYQIESDMRSGSAKVVEYWEAVFKHLHIYKAKACLKEIHGKMLKKNLHRLERPLEDTGKLDESEPNDEEDDMQEIEGTLKIEHI